MTHFPLRVTCHTKNANAASVADHWNVVVQLNDIHMIVVVVPMMIVVNGRSVYTCDNVLVSVEKKMKGY